MQATATRFTVRMAILCVAILACAACRNDYRSREELAPLVKLTKPDGKGPFPALALLHGCGGMLAMETLAYRVNDAYLAKAYLGSLDCVDSDRIGMMGGSHGGTATIKSVNQCGEPARGNPFAAAVAVYPACCKSIDPASPLLILSGGEDHWTPAAFCRRHAPADSRSERFHLTVYPEAYHCFDWADIDTEQFGHILRHCPASAAHAFVRVKAFVQQHVWG